MCLTLVSYKGGWFYDCMVLLWLAKLVCYKNAGQMYLNHILKTLRNAIALLMDVSRKSHFSKLYSIARHALLHTSGYDCQYHNSQLTRILARACGVPVGRRSGCRLATRLVATKNNIIAKLSSS